MEETNKTETVIDDNLSGEDTAVNITFRTEHNAPLAYNLGLELHHPIMRKIGDHGGQ